MSEWREYGEIGECRVGGNWREWRVERVDIIERL